MELNNIIYTLDSYKQLHDVMYPEGTQYVYSYGEARKGGDFSYNVSFGTQYVLKRWLEGVRVTKQLIDEAEPILKEHFKFCGDVWSRDKWDYIVYKHGGKLPIVIRIIPEGYLVPSGNFLISIENTDPNCWWLTNALETVLQHVWYPTTVATSSHSTVSFIKQAFKETVDENLQWLADFYLHDFGQRGVTCMEQAGIGGMAHLVNSKGTDSDMAMPFAMKYYNARLDGLAYSVPASEHSIATSLGKDDEFEVTKRLIRLFPKGILSIVSDSYDIENAIKVYCNELKPLILARDGKFVVRPDSPRFKGDTASQQVVWIANQLEKGFGASENVKGFKVLHNNIGIIYGDGLSQQDIFDTINALKQAGYAASTCVFGQGGGLLQKVNRDTCRFAFKSSAQCRNGVWHDIYKEPKDVSKASKRGKLKPVWEVGAHGKTLVTVPITDPRQDISVEVFRNGHIVREFTFDEVRENSQMKLLGVNYP